MPPLAVTLAEPVGSDAQLAVDVAETWIVGGSDNVTVCTEVAPPASVMVTVCVPALKPETVAGCRAIAPEIAEVVATADAIGMRDAVTAAIATDVVATSCGVCGDSSCNGLTHNGNRGRAGAGIAIAVGDGEGYVVNPALAQVNEV